MRKESLMIALAAVAMFSSCSNDEPIGTAADVPVGFSDVPIRLSSGGATRASIESDDNGLFEAEGLGIFALAKSVMDVNPSPIEITWGGDAPGTRTYAVLLDNEEANAVKNENGLQTDIVFADGQQHYYPSDNWYCYQFYGYYPRTETIESSATQRVAVVPLNGTQDLIYGKTTCDESYAYSARYFRQSGNEQKVPAMPFTHKLMRITFSAIAGPDTEGGSTYANVKDVAIKKIEVVGVPKEARLVVADYETPDNDGTVTYNWESNLTDFTLCDANDEPIDYNDYGMEVSDNSPVEKSVGNGILLPVPEAEGDYKYKVRVTLCDKNNGTEFQVGEPQELSLTGDNQFEAGKSYNVKLTINGPKAIGLSATLSKWETVGGALGDLTF